MSQNKLQTLRKVHACLLHRVEHANQSKRKRNSAHNLVYILTIFEMFLSLQGDIEQLVLIGDPDAAELQCVELGSLVS